MALLQRIGESSYLRSRDRNHDSPGQRLFLVVVSSLALTGLAWPAIETLLPNEPTTSTSPKQAVSAQAADTAAAVSSALAQRDSNTPPSKAGAGTSVNSHKKPLSSKLKRLKK